MLILKIMNSNFLMMYYLTFFYVLMNDQMKILMNYYVSFLQCIEIFFKNVLLIKKKKKKKKIKIPLIYLNITSFSLLNYLTMFL